MRSRLASFSSQCPVPLSSRCPPRTSGAPALLCGDEQVNEVAAVISEIVADDANIIFGTSVDESFQDEISVTVVATSFGEHW